MTVRWVQLLVLGGSKPHRWRHTNNKVRAVTAVCCAPTFPPLSKNIGTECCRPLCGLPYNDFPGAEESDHFEVEITAHRQRIYRKRYKKGCSCQGFDTRPEIIATPPPPKVIPEPVEHSLEVPGCFVSMVYCLTARLNADGLIVGHESLRGAIQNLLDCTQRDGKIEY